VQSKHGTSSNRSDSKPRRSFVRDLEGTFESQAHSSERTLVKEASD
jgi:hypothetical protein